VDLAGASGDSWLGEQEVIVSSESITGEVTWFGHQHLCPDQLRVRAERRDLANRTRHGDQGPERNRAELRQPVRLPGRQILAEGTPHNPIIFTAETDDLDRPEDLLITDRGLWGGVVLLGKARINKAVNAAGDAATPKYEVFEGLEDLVINGPEFVHRFGGNRRRGQFRRPALRVDPAWRAALSPDKEINGLTLGGVGRGTVVEFVEVLSFADDGFEFFGGSVNTKYLVSAFNDDDGFDTDMGWSGKNQFWLGSSRTTDGTPVRSKTGSRTSATTGRASRWRPMRSTTRR
jgi:hypothetical protein